MKILYEDPDVLVVDKPASIVVNRAESVKGTTVQEWAEKKFKIQPACRQGRSSKFKEKIQTLDQIDDFYRRSGIVHRLDKETSGVLLLAKNPESFSNLQSQFKNRIVEKKYKALVHGRVVPEKGSVRAPIGRLPWNRAHFGVFTGGRESSTDYVVTAFYHKEHEEFTLLEVTPHTGRTHQIRVHLQYIQHPVVSDELYAGRKRAKSDRMWCPRLFLHAYSLMFEQPKTKKKITVTSELPEELKEVLDNLAIVIPT